MSNTGFNKNGYLSNDELFAQIPAIETECNNSLSRPVPGPKPQPVPPKPVPPKPVPPKPTPTTNLVFADGLEVCDDNIVKVKADERNKDYMFVTMNGISIEPLIRKIEKQEKIIKWLSDRCTDMESDINILKGKTNKAAITNTLVSQSKSFKVNDDGKIEIKTTDGVKTNDDGSIAINSGDTLKIDAEGAIQVDYDKDTLGLVGEGDDKTLGTIYGVWESDNNETE